MGTALAYIQYRRRAQSRHGVHSPFVYELVDKVLRAKGAIRSREIELLRGSLRRDDSAFRIQDFGAGSRVLKNPERKVSELASVSATPKTVAMMLQRLIIYYNLKNLIELGTNLGITTAYVAAAPSVKKLISIEGDPNLASIARENLKKLNLEAEIETGAFEDLLKPAIGKLGSVDFAYLDGNHRKLPTLAYFESLVPALKNDSVIAIGDIHWSAEMEEAWEEIKKHPSVRVTVDIFHLGLVFFRKEMTREHFIIKFS